MKLWFEWKSKFFSIIFLVFTATSFIHAQTTDLGNVCTEVVLDYIDVNNLPLNSEIIWESAWDDEYWYAAWPDWTQNYEMYQNWSLISFAFRDWVINSWDIMKIKWIVVWIDLAETWWWAVCNPHPVMWVEVTTPLPIEITSFEWRALEYGHNVIELEVAQQLNTDRIELERSYDGVHFELVSSLKWDWNSSESKTFTFHDRAFNRLAKTVNYRAKDIDFDWGFSYSSIISINNADEFTPTIDGSNVVARGQDLRIAFPDAAHQVKHAKVFSMSGEVYEPYFNFESNGITVETFSLSQGMHILSITTVGGYQIKYRFMVSE